jgi:hypothetical protein
VPLKIYCNAFLQNIKVFVESNFPRKKKDQFQIFIEFPITKFHNSHTIGIYKCLVKLVINYEVDYRSTLSDLVPIKIIFGNVKFSIKNLFEMLNFLIKITREGKIQKIGQNLGAS